MEVHIVEPMHNLHNIDVNLTKGKRGRRVKEDVVIESEVRVMWGDGPTNAGSL